MYRTDPRPRAMLTLTVRVDADALDTVAGLAADFARTLAGVCEVTGGAFTSDPDADGRRVALDLHATATTAAAAAEPAAPAKPADEALDAALDGSASGGGWYLIDGRKYHGRAKARAALTGGA